MRKADEIALWSAVRESRRTGLNIPVHPDISDMLGINENRANSLLIKWSGRGWWDYGVSARFGWFTDEAPSDLSP